MDYLGIAKATIAGDLGGINAIDFQLKYRNRVTVSIAQNKIIDLDAKGGKGKGKDPVDLNCMMNVWNWVVPFDKNAKPVKEKFSKKFRTSYALRHLKAGQIHQVVSAACL